MAEEFEVDEVRLIFDRQSTEVGQLAKTTDGNTIMNFKTSSEHAEAVVQAAGWRSEKHYDLSDGAKCDVDDHRTCEMRVAVGMMLDVSQTEGVEPTPKLARILDEQAASETQIRQAADEWAKSIPADRQEEAQGIVYIVHHPAEVMQE